MPPPDGVDLVPVDHDPWGGDVNAALPEAYQDPNRGLGAGLLRMISGAATLPQRAIQNSQWSVDTGNYDPGPTLEAAMLPMGTGAIAGVPVKGAEAVLGAGPIRAYHGSPHDFDAFDINKIGTGEGAQAYGHGLYFAENPKTAEMYRDKLGGQDVNSTARSYLKYNNWDKDKAIAQMEAEHAKMPEFGKDVVDRIRNQIKNSKASMYEVNINADPEHFLDWDKPLREQSQAVKDTLGLRMTEQLGPSGYLMKSDKLGGWHNPDNTGAALYQSGDKVAAAQRFSDAGIPGIKYLDQGSRGLQDAGEIQRQIDRVQATLAQNPSNATAKDLLSTYQKQLADSQNASRNYVVFNDKIVDILRKYGLAGLSTLPPALQAAAHQQLTPVDHDPFSPNGS